MFKKVFSKAWPFLIIVIIAVTFHIKLFFPQASLYITPDYARSDLVHSKIPTQYVMWKVLHEKRLPLWENNIYQGYPEIEGLEMGFFYLPNLILFGSLPFWLAFNLGYVANAVIAGIGTYLLARSFRVSKAAALVAAITFTYSPIFMLHYHHYNLILAISWIPWLFWLINSFFNTRRYIFLTIIPYLIAEQYFAGSPQIPTYNLFFLFAFFLFKLKQNNLTRTTSIRLALFLMFSILVGFLIAAVQLIPTYKLLINSRWIENINPESILTQFPFKVKNLLTVFDPYILGNPKYGTYQHWQPGTWGLFWESNFYFGITQLVLLLVSIFVFFKVRFRQTLGLYIFWCSLFITGILLSLGTQSPLHPIFSIPPFSFFRVPSRFLFISFLAASQLAALSIESLGKSVKNKKMYSYLTIILIVVVTGDVIRVWQPYNLLGSAKSWSSPPPLTQNIRIGRQIDIGQYDLWNQTFLSKGWSDQQEQYLFYRNFMSPNLNLIFNIPQLYGYESFVPKRIRLIEQLSKSGITVDKNELTIGKASQKVLDFSNVRYLTTQYNIKSADWKIVNHVEKDGAKIFLYENLKYMPHAFIVNNYKLATTVNDFSKIVISDDFDPRKSAILEEEINIDKTNEIEASNNVIMLTYKNVEVALEAQTQKKSLLVLSDTFYDGWRAYIDKKETKIYPVNGNSRGIALPEGKHRILFLYKPSIFYTGLMATILSFFTSLIILIRLKDKRL